MTQLVIGLHVCACGPQVWLEPSNGHATPCCEALRGIMYSMAPLRSIT